jgi:hypothetical protein
MVAGCERELRLERIELVGRHLRGCLAVNCQGDLATGSGAAGEIYCTSGNPRAIGG